MAHLAVLVIFVNCVNDEISLVGWKYYSKATIGICGEHQTNLGALTANGLIMLVFLIYKFRISYFQPTFEFVICNFGCPHHQCGAIMLLFFLQKPRCF